ncbi:LamG domain-containing protein [Candidatus Poribacteria bacterium]
MKTQFSVVFISLIFAAFSATATMADLLDGLMGYWPLDEGSGKTARDASGNGHNGTLDNGPKWVTGADAKIGAGALLFDGTDDRVSIDSFDAVGGDGITIACWFNASNLDTPGDDPRMVSKAIGGNNEDHWFMLSSSREGGIKILRFRLRTDDEITSEKKATPAGIIELNVWIHTAVTWDGSTMMIYKDGVEVGTLPKVGKLATDPAVKMAIGNQPDGAENRPFDGIIDDVAIWNRPLTPAEIGEVMASGVPVAVEPGGKLAITWGKIKH